MGGEWTETTWGEIATLDYGKALRNYSAEQSEARVFGTNGPVGWHSEALWNGPGVIVGRKGAYRGVHYTNQRYWVIDTAYSLQPKPGVQMDMRWAYYQVRHLDPNTIDDGSPIPSTTRPAFYAQTLLFPPIEEQQGIAELLGALDDKIDVNRQMAETLDATAQALFKSWFVDFDPVRAKAEGRPTGLADALDTLFPDRFADNGLPEGWIQTPFADELAVTKGNSYKSADLAPSRVALVTLKSFSRGGGYRHDGLKPFTGPYKAGQVVAPGELVIAATDVTQAAEIVGQPAIVDDDSRFETLVASLDTFIARPKERSPWFWALALREQGFARFAHGYTTGTTVLHLSNRVFDDFGFVLPSNRELLRIAELALAPTIERRIMLTDQSRTLTELRDTLLPKLISGQIRIRDAERQVVAA